MKLSKEVISMTDNMKYIVNKNTKPDVGQTNVDFDKKEVKSTAKNKLEYRENSQKTKINKFEKNNKNSKDKTNKFKNTKQNKKERYCSKGCCTFCGFHQCGYYSCNGCGECTFVAKVLT